MFSNTLTPTGNLQSPLSLIWVFWIVGGSWSDHRKPTHAWKWKRPGHNSNRAKTTAVGKQRPKLCVSAGTTGEVYKWAEAEQ